MSDQLFRTRVSRPPLSRQRVEGLVLMAERYRNLAADKTRRSNLIAGTPADRKKLRAALDFVDALAAWARGGGVRR